MVTLLTPVKGLKWFFIYNWQDKRLRRQEPLKPHCGKNMSKNTFMDDLSKACKVWRLFWFYCTLKTKTINRIDVNQISYANLRYCNDFLRETLFLFSKLWNNWFQRTSNYKLQYHQISNYFKLQHHHHWFSYCFYLAALS